MSRAFSSGTGFAGLFGAFLWWSIRGFGVRAGVGSCTVGRSYCSETGHVDASCLGSPLPPTSLLLLRTRLNIRTRGTNAKRVHANCYRRRGSASTAHHDPQVNLRSVLDCQGQVPARATSLGSLHDPLVFGVLCEYTLLHCRSLAHCSQFEYTINQGVSPTLSYPPPSTTDHPILGRLFRTRGDFYVVWQVR